MFLEIVSLQEIQKAVNDEILAQMKYKTTDADKMERRRKRIEKGGWG